MLNSTKTTAHLLWRRLLNPELEATTQPTVVRVRILAGGIAFSHLFFGYLMSQIAPQPFENLWLRLGMALIALLLLAHSYKPIIPRTSLYAAFVFNIWLHLNFFAVWMYAMNGYNGIWLSYLCTSIMMSFLLIKWRQVLMGLLIAVIFAPLLAEGLGRAPGWPSATHLVILSLATGLSLLHALALGGVREQHLRQTLALSRLVQSHIHGQLVAMQSRLALLQALSQKAEPAASAKRLEKIAQLFEENIHGMDRYLHSQRSNAGLLDVVAPHETLMAGDLVQTVLTHYPYPSSSAKRAISLKIDLDFSFSGNRQQWELLLSNLIKNALDALAETKLRINPGDLLIAVGARGRVGRISVRDKGLPIEADVIGRVFEPFYSAGPSAGLGLGLSFSRRVAQASGGRMSVYSDGVNGTVFHVYVPRLNETGHDAGSSRAAPAQKQNLDQPQEQTPEHGRAPTQGGAA